MWIGELNYDLLVAALQTELVTYATEMTTDFTMNTNIFN